MEQHVLNAVFFLLAGLILWATTFAVSWLIVPRVSVAYSTMPLEEQASFVGRVHSSLHGVIVPIGAAVCLSQCNLLSLHDERTAFLSNECESIEWYTLYRRLPDMGAAASGLSLFPTSLLTYMSSVTDTTCGR